MMFSSKISFILGLPNIPKNLTAREIRKNRSAQLNWNVSEVNGSVIYVLQQRSHPGRTFNPSALNPWTTRHHSKRNSAVVKDLRPGNWYVFRVASVNINGTKGFSQQSQEFTLSEGMDLSQLLFLLNRSNTAFCFRILFCVPENFI